MASVKRCTVQLNFASNEAMNLKRRSILAAGLLLPTTQVAGKKSTNVSGQPAFPLRATDTLLAQAGIYGKELFVVGVLRCTDPDVVQGRIDQIRRLTRFRCTLSHHSRNKFKVPFLSHLIDDWMRNDELSLFIRIVPALTSHPSMTAQERLSNYAGDLTSAMAMGGGISRIDGRIVTQPRYKSGTQQAALDQLLTVRNPRANSIEKISRAQSDLLQFLTTITGMIRAHEFPERAMTRNPYKSVAIAKLRTSIGAKSFAAPIATRKLQIVVASQR